jgi:hypothetical protein
MKRFFFLCTIAFLSVSANDWLSAQSVPTPRGEVTLPLADYLSLVERVDAAEQAAEARSESSEPAVAALVSQEASIVWPSVGQADFADVTTRFEVLLQGEYPKPVLLPVTGLTWRTEVEPASDVSLRMTDDGLELVASAIGRYQVTVSSRARILQSLGTHRLHVAPLRAPVGKFEVDLPESLLFQASGAVMAEESIRNGRRHVSFALPKGEGATLQVRRDVEGDESEKVIADVAVATIVELNQDGALRHDVLLYRVSRGEMSSFELTLPSGLEPTRLVTDESEAPLVVEGRTVRVDRTEKLSGVGYLVLTSALAQLDTIPLGTIEPGVPVRQRFLILSSSIAAKVVPLPETSFRRVDISDVPPALLDAVTVEMHAAWRLKETEGRPTLRVDVSPQATTIETVIRERESLTLLTTEGILVHRDTFTIQTSATTFELELPPGSKLWSSRVNGTWVRSVERHGAVLIPLGFGSRNVETVEIVSVSERVLPKRRSRLELDLGEMSAPVLLHSWRLLLPEHNAYRYSMGDLKPVVPRGMHSLLPRQEPSQSEHGPISTVLGRGGSSGMRVRVLDEREIVLPGATVTVSNERTGWTGSAISNHDGRVWFASLPSGSYSLSAALSGFATTRFESIPLVSGETPAYAIMLGMATVAETITVTGEAPLIDRRRSGTTSTFRRSRYTGTGPAKPAQRSNETALYRREAGALRRGLTAGVKPIPINIPEDGKLLELVAALPPDSVRVVLDVKPN